MESKFQELVIEQIKLDESNPRIQRYLQEYGNEISSEGIALALNTSSDNSGNSYDTLCESIRVSKGIIHPILVNHQENGDYVVIEGNTRLQIYKEFKETDPDGPWGTIMCIVYEQLTPAEIDGIRLQSHLVGPRDWDAYSKAKYLNQLSNVDYLPMSTIISYCGGKAGEINKLIRAYNDMEKFYSPLVHKAGQTVDPREFSKFSELQSKGLLEVIASQNFTKQDFAQWVFDDRIDTAMNVRKLRYILVNKSAREKFLKSNITEAEKLLNIEQTSSPVDLSIYELANELKKRIINISRIETKNLKTGDGGYDKYKDDLIDLKQELDDLISDITEE